MKEFRSHIILEIHKQRPHKLDLRALYPRCCIVSLSFVKGAIEEMEDPCWINLIHLGALRMLRDETGISYGFDIILASAMQCFAINRFSYP